MKKISLKMVLHLTLPMLTMRSTVGLWSKSVYCIMFSIPVPCQLNPNRVLSQLQPRVSPMSKYPLVVWMLLPPVEDNKS